MISVLSRKGTTEAWLWKQGWVFKVLEQSGSVGCMDSRGNRLAGGDWTAHLTRRGVWHGVHGAGDDCYQHTSRWYARLESLFV